MPTPATLSQLRPALSQEPLPTSAGPEPAQGTAASSAEPLLNTARTLLFQQGITEGPQTLLVLRETLALARLPEDLAHGALIVDMRPDAERSSTVLMWPAIHSSGRIHRYS